MDKKNGCDSVIFVPKIQCVGIAAESVTNVGQIALLSKIIQNISPQYTHVFNTD